MKSSPPSPDLEQSSGGPRADETLRPFPHAPASVRPASDPAPSVLNVTRLVLAHIGFVGFLIRLNIRIRLTGAIRAALALFLATTDATVVSTCLPSIVADLNGTESQYSWVGVAYLLTQTAFQPVYGALANVFGRKILLSSSLIIFVLGSILCGAAPSMDWLIASRAIAGIGGGGIVSCVWVLTAEIVPELERPKWSQALSLTWSASAVAGPLIGGVFSGTSRLTWRWAFYISGPIAAFASIILFSALWNVNLQSDRGGLDLKQFMRHTSRELRRLDFLGMIFFMSGTISIIIGFDIASGAGWSHPATLSLLVAGPIILVIGGLCQTYRTCSVPLFPSLLFKTRTTCCLLLAVFLHNFAFNAGTFYLALYFQAAKGHTPFQSGILMLSYSLGSAIASMPAAWFIGWWQRKAQNTSPQKYVMIGGLAISTVGFGLMTLLTSHSNLPAQQFFSLVAGIGLGALFHAPFQIIAKAVPSKALPNVTAAFFLVRFTGATTGLATGGAIFDSQLQRYLPAGIVLQSGSSTDLRDAIYIQPLALRESILEAIAQSVRWIWIVCVPCLGIACLASLAIKNLPIGCEDAAERGAESSDTESSSALSTMATGDSGNEK